jgi:hypothetical protein
MNEYQRVRYTEITLRYKSRPLRLNAQPAQAQPDTSWVPPTLEYWPTSASEQNMPRLTRRHRSVHPLSGSR